MLGTALSKSLVSNTICCKNQSFKIPPSVWLLRWSNFLLLMATTSQPVARNSSTSFRAGTLKPLKLNPMITVLVHFCRPIHINHCMLQNVLVWKDHISAWSCLAAPRAGNPQVSGCLGPTPRYNPAAPPTSQSHQETRSAERPERRTRLTGGFSKEKTLCHSSFVPTVKALPSTV